MKRDKLKDFLLEKDDDFKCLTLIKKIKDTDAVAFICQVSGCKNLEEFRRLSVKEKLNSFPLFDLGELGI